MACWGWNGGWRRWRCTPAEEKEGGRDETWSEVDAITGHQGPVKGLSWDPHGEYLISSRCRNLLLLLLPSCICSPSSTNKPHIFCLICTFYVPTHSLDQTTRIHAPWTRPDPFDPSTKVETWHELARPQIHGYDLMNCAFTDPLRFVSVADEKVARVFDAPQGFIRTLKALGSSAVQDMNEVRRVALFLKDE